MCIKQARRSEEKSHRTEIFRDLTLIQIASAAKAANQQIKHQSHTTHTSPHPSVKPQGQRFRSLQSPKNKIKEKEKNKRKKEEKC